MLATLVKRNGGETAEKKENFSDVPSSLEISPVCTESWLECMIQRLQVWVRRGAHTTAVTIAAGIYRN